MNDNCLLEVLCLVEWAIRDNQLQPKASYVSNKILGKLCPKILYDFYYDKILS